VSLLRGWGDKPHHDIVDAALSALPEDQFVERLGSGGWAIGGKRVSELEAQFYSNDYPISPGIGPG